MKTITQWLKSVFVLIAFGLLSACGPAGIGQEMPTPPETYPYPISQDYGASPSYPYPAQTTELQAYPQARVQPMENGQAYPEAQEAGEAQTPAYPAPQDVEPLEDPAEAALAAFPAAPSIDGEIILVYGRVVDRNGNPIQEARVEFWQTDANGVYDHPGDAKTESRDRNFQFYGTSVTGEDGVYLFRTIVPGEYEPRPAHIHVKVKLGGAELLTTQFYFAQDAENVQNEGVFRTAGEAGELLFLSGEARTDVNGTQVLLANKDIVIDTGNGGSLEATPSQTEGPYYPVVDVSRYNNDLLIVD